MIRFLILLMLSLSAWADTQPPIITTVDPAWRWQYGSTPHGKTGDLTSVRAQFPGICSGLMSSLGRSGPYGGTPTPMTGYNGYCTAGTGAMTAQEYVRIVPVCPSGSLTGSSYETYRCTGAKVCPSGYTLSLDGSLCERNLPPCPGLTTRYDGSNECRCNPDNPLVSNTTGVMVGGSGSIPSTVCFRSCTFQTGFGLGGGGVWNAYLGKTTGQSCTGGIENTKPPIAKKDPPCAEGEGVMTSSQGSVVCVPPGTEGARKPVVQDTQERSEENGVKTDKNKTTTKDPATSATTTTTTTTKTDENGNIQVSVGSVSSGAGGAGDNSGDEPGQCAKEPDSPMCRKGEPSAKGDFSGEEDAELERVKAELRDVWAQVSTQARAMWSGTLGSSGGSLPCPSPVIVLGKPFDICLARYEGQLSMVGAAVMLIAALLSAFIIFRR